MAVRTGYAIVKELADGGQAKVYKAVATSGNRAQVAVKVFRGAHAHVACQSEVRYLAAVQGHRNVARLIEGFDAHGGPCALVLELYARDLFRLATKRRMSETKAVDIMGGVLSALEHVHSLDIVHRDVKPENVALGRDGVARLMDFGVAASIHDRESMRTFPGSLGYAAPELLDKKPYGFSVDIFASGATFFFALSQRLPYATQDMTPASLSVRMRKGVISFGADFDHVSDDTQGAMRWLMHVNASSRPKASDALNAAPFGPALDAGRMDELPNAASDEPRPSVPVLEVRAPSQARERPPRPAPLARIRQDTSHGTSQATAGLVVRAP
eukprot:TRINITY_DN3535_c0_g2_i1.p1 TRINITY_DN3535_c0_g2~~TRINITY_DN3535_c0_g2_i1.p1  ORF type:complete len:328 (-),score=47.56 TRINITY_DN3535_c0_g2_i1:203-1186(-)